MTSSANVQQRAVLPPLPAPLQFAAGGIAGVTEILVMYPLDGTHFPFNNSRQDALPIASG